MGKWSLDNLPYYKYVPKEAKEHARYRYDVLLAAKGDEQLRRELWQMCAADPLFYINTFVWTYANKDHPDHPVQPFNTWEFQDEAIVELLNAIGNHDLLWKKSREMGATWMVLVILDWFCQFREWQSFMLVSRNADLVDSSGDPDTLMAKVDFVHRYLPDWLRPKVHRRERHIGYLESASALDGEASTGDAGRGGRRQATFADEFATFDSTDRGPRGEAFCSATSDATKCRIFCSTPKGVNTTFYKLEKKGDIICRFMKWTIHPLKNTDLEYNKDGKPTSSWYRARAKRSATPVETAQEVDMEDIGSDWIFYDPKLIARLVSESRPPSWTGDIEFDPHTFEPTALVADPEGPMQFWFDPPKIGEFPKDRRYVWGADISLGSGATNSVLTVGDTKTGEIVCDYVTCHMRPTAFAAVACAIGKLFGGGDGPGEAYGVWEDNGPGAAFREDLLSNGYCNYYLRETEGTIAAKTTRKPGWASTIKNKLTLLTNHMNALKSGTLKDPCKSSLEECYAYVYTPDGNIVHSASLGAEDPTQARTQHGDRVISRACCWLGMSKITHVEKKEEQKIPRYSPAWRMLERRKRADAAKVNPRLRGSMWKAQPRRVA